MRPSRKNEYLRVFLALNKLREIQIKCQEELDNHNSTVIQWDVDTLNALLLPAVEYLDDKRRELG